MTRDMAILNIYEHLCLSPFTHNILLNLVSISSADNVIPTFIFEKTGSLRGEMTYPKPHSKITESAF